MARRQADVDGHQRHAAHQHDKLPEEAALLVRLRTHTQRSKAKATNASAITAHDARFPKGTRRAESSWYFGAQIKRGWSGAAATGADCEGGTDSQDKASRELSS